MTPALCGIAKNLRREACFPPASPAGEEAPSPVARRKDLLPPPPLRPVVLDNCLRECRIAIGHLLDRKPSQPRWHSGYGGYLAVELFMQHRHPPSASACGRSASRSSPGSAPS